MAESRAAGIRAGARAAAIAGAVALGAAVYVTFGGGGNGADPACAAALPTAEALDPLVGGEVAAFQIATEPERLSDLAFMGPGGEKLTLAAFDGKVTLLNLWATWCAPCRQEMPALDRLQTALGGEDFAVVPVSIDTGGAERPAGFLKSVEVQNLPLYRDPSTEIFEALRTRSLALGLPVTVLLDRDGCRLGHMNGPAEWDSPEGQALIRAAIAAQEPQTTSGSAVL
jgi:thiol-disulfide isomerase/thioredoxin